MMTEHEKWLESRRVKWLNDRGYWLNDDDLYELRISLPFKDKNGNVQQLGFRSTIDMEKLMYMNEHDFEQYDKKVWADARSSMHQTIREGRK